jgi:effector-binding domain-containing protein
MADRDPTEPRIVELASQPTVAVRIQQPMVQLDLASAFARYLPKVGERVSSTGEVPVGPPYARYHEFGPEQVDLEIGVPVAVPISSLPPLAECAPAEIGASALPGGTAAVATHLGTYDTLSKTYDRIGEWLHDEAYTAGAGPWESYVDDPEEFDDLSQVRTEVYWPLF